jgi:hypothetical protein
VQVKCIFNISLSECAASVAISVAACMAYATRVVQYWTVALKMCAGSLGHPSKCQDGSITIQRHFIPPKVREPDQPIALRYYNQHWIQSNSVKGVRFPAARARQFCPPSAYYTFNEMHSATLAPCVIAMRYDLNVCGLCVCEDTN